MSHDQRLKRCPFCGGSCQTIRGEAGKDVWPHGKFWRVFCVKCQSRQLFHKSEAEAIGAWNHRAIRQQLTTAQAENDALRARVAGLESQKHKLKWKLALQSMHHVRLHNRWVCGELEEPEEEAIINPFMYAETEVWWAIGDEADGFAKELEAEDDCTQANELEAGGLR